MSIPTTGYGAIAMQVNEDSEVSSSSEKKNWPAIVISVLMMNAAYVFMGEALQGMEEDYDNVMVLTAIVAVSYAYCFLPWMAWAYLRHKPWAAPLVTQDAEQHPTVGAYTWRYLVVAAIPISILSKSCRDMWYYSLDHTNAAANAAIYQSSGAWVYGMSLCLLGDRFDWVKSLSLLFGIGGSVLVALESTDSSESGVDQNLGGYVEVVGSVLLYSLFQVVVKKLASHPNDPHPQMNSLRLCGIIGLWCLIWGPASVAFLHFTGLKPFKAPPRNIVLLAIANGVADAIYTGAMLICVRLADPTFASVAIIITVPLTVIADAILHGYTAPPLVYVGMFIIFCGCGLYNYRVYNEDKGREEEEQAAIKD